MAIMHVMRVWLLTLLWGGLASNAEQGITVTTFNNSAQAGYESHFSRS